MGSPEWRRRVSEGTKRALALRRERKFLRPRDYDRYRREGLVVPQLAPLVEIAEQEAAEIITALGGPDDLTPQRRVIVEDLAAVGIALRAQLMLFLSGAEGEHASRIGTLASVRRASLTALGLERREREIDLQAYLTQRTAENRSGATNANDPDPSSASACNAAPRGDEGGAPGSLSCPPGRRPHTSPDEPSTDSSTTNGRPTEENDDADDHPTQ